MFVRMQRQLSVLGVGEVGVVVRVLHVLSAQVGGGVARPRPRQLPQPRPRPVIVGVGVAAAGAAPPCARARVVRQRLEVERGLLRAAVRAVALVAVPAVRAALPAVRPLAAVQVLGRGGRLLVAGPRLLHHHDLVLVLDAAAAVAVLAAAAVLAVLAGRRDALQLDLYLVVAGVELGLAVAAPLLALGLAVAAPARPAAAPAGLPRPARRPAGRPLLSLHAAGRHVLGERRE